MKDKTITIFGIKFNNENPNLSINRENYAILDKKNHEVSAEKRRALYMKDFLESDKEELRNVAKHYFENISKIYEDDTFEMYTDEYCENHQKKCLYNYDLNMQFFKELDEVEFQSILDKLLKKFKKLTKIADINNLKETSGVYIMVLGNYHQIYVGESYDIYKRIRQHWTRKKAFMRLIFGSKDDSILSIDSFGPLDTTSIYVYECRNKEEVEEKIVSYIPNKFLLNRTRGGDRGNDEISVKLDTMAHRNMRYFTIRKENKDEE